MTTKLLNQLHGVLLPSTTPFTSTGDIDFGALNSNISKWCKTGISGIVLLGSTGERVHLNEREYQQLIEASRSEVSADLAFVVGSGQQSLRGTINEIDVAVQAGADAVLVLTPHFYKSAITQDTLIEFFTRIADSSKVPVLLYSMPALTGVKIEAATIARLSEHQNIIGVKDSSNDIAGFAETVRICPTEFAVMTGNGTVLLDALKSGATGGILAVGCAVPEVCLEVLENFKEGRLNQAESMQSKLTPLAAAVTTRFGIGGLKAAMDLAGYIGSNVRAPLSSPTEAQRSEIAELLKAVALRQAI